MDASERRHELKRSADETTVERRFQLLLLETELGLGRLANELRILETVIQQLQAQTQARTPLITRRQNLGCDDP